jgi:hypothetical protein
MPGWARTVAAHGPPVLVHQADLYVRIRTKNLSDESAASRMTEHNSILYNSQNEAVGGWWQGGGEGGCHGLLAVAPTWCACVLT